MAALSWRREGKGREVTTTPLGLEIVIVPEHGHFGNNIRGYQAYHENKLIAGAKRKAVLKKYLNDTLTQEA